VSLQQAGYTCDEYPGRIRGQMLKRRVVVGRAKERLRFAVRTQEGFYFTAIAVDVIIASLNP